MNNENRNIVVYGEMGKDGGHTPTEAKDNLVSEQTVKVLFAVSEGYIDEVMQVKLDGVSISSYDANYVVSPGDTAGALLSDFAGTQSVYPFPGIPSSLVYGASTKAAATNPSFTASQYFKYLTIPDNPPYSRIRISILINSLRAINKEGDMVGSSVSFDISTTTSPPNSSTPKTSIFTYKPKLGRTGFTKSGKTTNGYTFDVYVDRPAGSISPSGWGVVIERLTLDDNTVKTSRLTTIQQVITITDDSRTYPNTALIGIKLNNAKQFRNRIPDITFMLKGVRVKVPLNYNGVSRTYSGTGWALDNYAWAAAKQWTNNPAWILYDLLTSERYGLGIPENEIDLDSFMSLCLLADELVPATPLPDIKRYSFDYQFITREQPSVVLGQILSVCDSNLVLNEFGQLSISCLFLPQSVARQVTNQNVIDGSFTYSSTGIEQRSNLINVTYNNNDNFGRTDTITAQDDDAITRYGLQTLDLMLPGCTNVTRAIRKAYTVLYINNNFTEIVNFSVLFEGMVYKIGDVIRVVDEYTARSPLDNSFLQRNGRLKSIAGTTEDGKYIYSIDQLLYVRAGEPRAVKVITPDGVEHTMEIPLFADYLGNTLSETYDTTYIAFPTSLGDLSNLVFTVVYSDVNTIATGAPTIYRVINISKSEDEIYSISAVNMGKYEEGLSSLVSYVDSYSTWPFPTMGYGNTIVNPAPDITNLTAVGKTIVVNKKNMQTIFVDWDSATVAGQNNDTDIFYPFFTVIWSKDSLQEHMVEKLTVSDFTLSNIIPGNYKFTVYSVNPITGKPGTPSTVEYQYGKPQTYTSMAGSLTGSATVNTVTLTPSPTIGISSLPLIIEATLNEPVSLNVTGLLVTLTSTYNTNSIINTYEMGIEYPSTGVIIDDVENIYGSTLTGYLELYEEDLINQTNFGNGTQIKVQAIINSTYVQSTSIASGTINIPYLNMTSTITAFYESVFLALPATLPEAYDYYNVYRIETLSANATAFQTTYDTEAELEPYKVATSSDKTLYIPATPYIRYNYKIVHFSKMYGLVDYVLTSGGSYVDRTNWIANNRGVSITYLPSISAKTPKVANNQTFTFSDVTSVVNNNGPQYSHVYSSDYITVLNPTKGRQFTLKLTCNASNIATRFITCYLEYKTKDTPDIYTSLLEASYNYDTSGGVSSVAFNLSAESIVNTLTKYDAANSDQVIFRIHVLFGTQYNGAFPTITSITWTNIKVILLENEL